MMKKSTANKLDQSMMQHLLGYVVKRASVGAKKVFDDSIGHPLQLSAVEFTILCLLINNQRATQKHLAAALGLSAPNLTTLIDKLVERGLLLRERSDVDKRSQLVKLTPNGLELAHKAHQISLTMEAPILKNLSDAEKAILTELLNKVINT